MVWVGVLSQIVILLFLYVIEFINTKDPEPDLASRTKVRNEPVTETNKSKANTKRTSPAQVPGMADTLFWYAEERKVLIWYTGSFGWNPQAPGLGIYKSQIFYINWEKKYLDLNLSIDFSVCKFWEFSDNSLCFAWVPDILSDVSQL
jgi:hypothetical protein